MSTGATIVAFLAFAGAVASWVFGALFYLRTLGAFAGRNEKSTRWLAIVAWPFALKHLKGAGAEHAANVNKALVTFFACLLVAAAMTSVAPTCRVSPVRR